MEGKRWGWSPDHQLYRPMPSEPISKDELLNAHDKLRAMTTMHQLLEELR